MSTPWEIAATETRQRGPLELLVVQPTPFCNLDCDYCYLPFRQSRRRMQLSTLTKLFERVFASSLVRGPFTVVWHAGEPLVLPIEFYAEAFEVIDALNHTGIRVDHSIQTNGTLITPDWCQFISKTGLRIGVSIDGPEFLHDLHRKTRTGRGTHANVLRGIRLLHQFGVPFHVITVLTRHSLGFPDQMFEFFLHERIFRIGFNIEEIEGPHLKSSLEDKDALEEYVKFISRFFDCLHSSSSCQNFAIREFDSILSAILTRERRHLPHQLNPMAIVSVDFEGNFSTFSPELLGLQSAEFGDFVFGNVHQNCLEDILEDPRFLRMEDEIRAGVDQCRRACPYFEFCGGGAPVNKFFENGSFDSTETLFCRMSVQANVDVVVSKLEASFVH